MGAFGNRHSVFYNVCNVLCVKVYERVKTSIMSLIFFKLRLCITENAYLCIWLEATLAKKY